MPRRTVVAFQGCAGWRAGRDEVIEARQLRRDFGRVRAVNDVSFTAYPGTVTGFLGPNGAGKTTTLRLLATFLAPTAGTATVAGFDIVREPLEVRRRIGYLPENTPLPGELRVGEYLRLRAEVKGIPRGRVRAAIDEVVERLDLGDVRQRLVGQLSLGYRQRVGLADTLLGSPPVLILDEPTSHLDPEQASHVRHLLRDLARERTVFVSTHLLAEAEQTCGELVILAGGRVVATGTPDQIAKRYCPVQDQHSAPVPTLLGAFLALTAGGGRPSGAAGPDARADGEGGST